MTTTLIDGCEIAFEEKGEGEPLLLLHGGLGTGRDWRHVFDLDALAKRYRLIVPDARGHGHSTDPAGAFSFRRCGADVTALLDYLGIDEAHAVGVSLGAKTLLHVATSAPSRIRRMVLVSAAPRFPEATRAAMRAYASAERTPAEWNAMRAQHVHGDDQIRALWDLGKRFADDPDDMSFTADRLRGVTAKTLVVAGDRDFLYPVELAVELYRGIPNAALYVVPGGGHSPIFHGEREAFVARALSFLSE
jgi:pimeloyl-ACP methyl ester carboxylesterase